MVYLGHKSMQEKTIQHCENILDVYILYNNNNNNIIIISLNRNLYCEGTLCPDIRCSLADALVAAVSSDLKGNVLFLTRKRKKKGQSLANWCTKLYS